MVGGIQYPRILTNQFIARILADGAELVVHIGDRAVHVSCSHDSVLVESKLLIGKILEDLFSFGSRLGASH